MLSRQSFCAEIVSFSMLFNMQIVFGTVISFCQCENIIFIRFLLFLIEMISFFFIFEWEISFVPLECVDDCNRKIDALFMSIANTMWMNKTDFERI